MAKSQQRPEMWHGQAETTRFVQEHRDALIDAVLFALASEIDEYAAIPAEAFEVDIAANVALGIDRFQATLVCGSQPTDDELQDVRDSAARRAEDGVPLATLVQGYAVATRVVFDQFAATVEDPVVLGNLASLGFDHLRVLASAAATGYLEEYRATRGAEKSHDQVVLDALLAGHDLPADADQARWEAVTILRFALSLIHI